jgi:hypothetical protein
MRNHILIAAAFSLLLAVGGCSKQSPTDSAPPAPGAAPVAGAAPATDKWLGQWTGPEGTFLRLEGGQGKYTVTIQNLDGPRTFQGSASGGTVTFERDGVVETIHATDGATTGMKWLAEKSDCLTVRTGEGYCR